MLVGVYEFVLDSYAGQSSTTKSLNVQLISAEILTPDATGNVRSGCSGTFQLGPGSELKLPMSSLVFVFLVCLQCFHVSWSRFLLRSLIFISCHNVWKTVTLFSCKNFLNNVSASFSSRPVTVTGHPRTSLSPTPQTYSHQM